MLLRWTEQAPDLPLMMLLLLLLLLLLSAGGPG
jgi:hypothetical protein